MPRPKKNATPKTLLGAEEFAGPDTEQEAREKIAAARSAATKEEEADKKNGDNGGPIMDQDAWRRACVEYSAEMLDIEEIESQKAEIAQRISSIRKRSKKLGVDWDLVKRYYDDHKRIRKGSMGAMFTAERRYRQLLQFMGSPLGTQTSLWDVEVEQPEGEAPKDEKALEAEATLAGEHAGLNGEPKDNNPYWNRPGTAQWFGWNNGHQIGVDKLADNLRTGNTQAGGEGASH